MFTARYGLYLYTEPPPHTNTTKQRAACSNRHAVPLNLVTNSAPAGTKLRYALHSTALYIPFGYLISTVTITISTVTIAISTVTISRLKNWDLT